MMARSSSQFCPGFTEDSKDGDSISCFLDEENLIDCLFYNCDVKQTGLVRVSELMGYLINITDTGENSKENMELLLDIMDPQRCDPEIDIDAYRERTATWIDKLNNDSCCGDTAEPPSGTTVVFSNSVPSSPVKRGALVNRLLQLNVTSQTSRLISPLKPIALKNRSILSPLVSSPSFDGSPDVDTGCLCNRVADLEFKNRFLSEEVNSLKEQLEQSEDAVATLSQERDKLKAEIKNHLLNIDRLHEVLVENEELKTALTAAESSKHQLQKELDALERDHHALVKEKESLVDELFNAQEELCTLQEERHAIVEYKTICQNTMKKEEEQASQLALKHAEVDELRSVIADVSALNESLRKEKKDLELHLAESVQGTTESVHLSVIDEVTEDSIVSENEEQIPVTLIPDRTSTPRLSSIRKELEQSLLTDAPCVPSPLCDKEMDNILLTNIKPLMLDMSLTGSPEVQLSDLSNVGSYLQESDSSNKQEQPRTLVEIAGDKKPYLLKRIADTQNNNQVAALSEDDKLDQIAEKMSRLVYEKLAAEQKVYKYCAVLQKLHDLYQMKETQHTESEKALEADCKSLTAEVDNLKQMLLEEKRKNEDLEEKFELHTRDLALRHSEQNTLRLESDMKVEGFHQNRVITERIESIEHSGIESLADNNLIPSNNNTNTQPDMSKRSQITDLVIYARSDDENGDTDDNSAVQLFPDWQTVFTCIAVGFIIMLGLCILLAFIILKLAVASGAGDWGIQQLVELKHTDIPPF